MSQEPLLTRLRELAYSITAHPPLPLLMLLIGVFPVLAHVSQSALLGPLGLLGAVVLWQAERHAPLDTATFIRRELYVFVVTGGMIAAYLMYQVYPIPGTGSPHPLWDSVQSVLGGDVPRAPYTIDVSATVDGLLWSGIMGTLSFAVLLTSVERHSAYLVTVALAITLAAWSALGGFAAPFSSGLSSFIDASSARFAGILGAILVLADALRRFDHSEGVRLLRNRRGRNKRRKILAHLVAFPVCSYAALAPDASGFPGSGTLPFVTGSMIVLSLAALRRSKRDASALVIAGLAVVFAVGMAALLHHPRPELAALKGSHPDPLIEALLLGAPATGFGFGTFWAARDMVAGSDATYAPTLFTKLAIETGLVPAFILMAAGVFTLIKLFVASAGRGRDWHFSAQAAAVLGAILTGAFYVSDPVHVTHMLALVFIVTIGLAQVRGRDREKLS